MKFIYPAIFKEEDDVYLVSFPDFEGCQTYGENLIEAYEMAKEVLELFICDYFGENIRAVPDPSDPVTLKLDHGSFLSLIYTDFDPVKTYIESKEAAEAYNRKEKG